MDKDSIEARQLVQHLENLERDIEAVQTAPLIPKQVKNACAEMLAALNIMAKAVLNG